MISLETIHASFERFDNAVAALKFAEQTAQQNRSPLGTLPAHLMDAWAAVHSELDESVQAIGRLHKGEAP